MKKASKRGRTSGLRAEYSFDYGKSRPNRFAGRIRGDVRTVVLDPDVASKFRTSKSVNDVLRSVLSTSRAERRGRAARRKKAV
jgi:hypothetical protein